MLHRHARPGRAGVQRDGFTRADLLPVAAQFGVKRSHDLIAQVTEAVSRWPQFATDAGVAKDQMKAIGKTHRLNLAPGAAH